MTKDDWLNLLNSVESKLLEKLPGQKEEISSTVNEFRAAVNRLEEERKCKP